MKYYLFFFCTMAFSLCAMNENNEKTPLKQSSKQDAPSEQDVQRMREQVEEKKHVLIQQIDQILDVNSEWLEEIDKTDRLDPLAFKRKSGSLQKEMRCKKLCCWFFCCPCMALSKMCSQD